MPRVRVLHIIPNLHAGGAQHVMLHLVLGLDRRAFEVGVCSLYDSRSDFISKRLTERGISVWHLGKRRGVDVKMFSRILSVLSAFRPSIIHTHQYVLRYSLLPAVLHRIPVLVHTVHTMPDREVGRPGRWVHSIAFAVGTIPVAVCDEVATGIDQLYRLGQVTVIPNGIPISDAAVQLSPRCSGDTVFPCVANLTTPKNIPMLIKAFAAGPARYPDARLAIVGDGSLRVELERYAASLNLADRIEFLGARSDVPELLESSDVFVLSSDWEGRPLSVMEAMASGRPVICTAVGGVQKLVDNEVHGIVVRPGDCCALAASMVRLYQDRGLRQRLGDAAKKRASSEFNAKLMVERYVEMYGTRLRRANNKGD